MKSESKLAFPLQWPMGYKRTPIGQTVSSKFKQTMNQAQEFLRSELNRLRATEIVISTNAPVRNDGGLYYDWMKKKSINDPGVAVYFKYKGKDTVLCADKYKTIWENIYAIAKTVENLRGIDRWGVSDFLSRSFSGFGELPPSTVTVYKSPYKIFGYEENCQPKTFYDLSIDFKKLAMKLHPDIGGSEESMKDLNWAYNELQRIWNYK